MYTQHKIVQEDGWSQKTPTSKQKQKTTTKKKCTRSLTQNSHSSVLHFAIKFFFRSFFVPLCYKYFQKQSTFKKRTRKKSPTTTQKHTYTPTQCKLGLRFSLGEQTETYNPQSVLSSTKRKKENYCTQGSPSIVIIIIIIIQY